MKKIITLITVFLAFLNIGFAQNSSKLDSLRHELSIAKNDSSRAEIMHNIGNFYRWNKPDSAIFYENKVIAIARKINSLDMEVGALVNITLAQITLGNDARALQINLRAIKIAEDNGLLPRRLGILIHPGYIYNMSKNYSNALISFKKVKAIADSTNNIGFNVIASSRIAQTFLYMNQLDSALYYGHLADDLAQKFNLHKVISKYVLGEIYFEKGNNELALKYLHEALLLAGNADVYFERAHKIAQVYFQMGIPDSSIFYANKALEVSLESEIYSNIIEANLLLSEIYEKREPGKALQYSKSAIAYNDTLDFIRKKTTLEDLTGYDAQERQYEIEQAQSVYKNRIQRLWIFSIAGALLSALFAAFILFRNNKNKQKANKILEQTLSNLKSTQAQLIQAEKMASLGELTAGIAHEIQNPLNFVNNFSEVNKELLDEMREEISKKNFDEVDLIAKDVIENEQKINHHGKRADAIVKGMLQHSRTSTGKKELTDINALADEYLRLSYHGLRAKDNTFNADFKTEFDENLPKIHVIPQDIGRVLLNLINNAFYAVDERARDFTPQPPEGGVKNAQNEYKPTVIVSTTSSKSHSGDLGVKITVKDNGPGIPQNIVDKIFQPFFTTKPTGSGTGLGLSLSYDIIKAHGGELTMETTKDEGTEFIIHIPI